MAGVMDGEDELVPEQTQGNSRKEEILCLEKVDESCKEGEVANAFDAIGVVRAVEEAGSAELLLERSIFADDLVL